MRNDAVLILVFVAVLVVVAGVIGLVVWAYRRNKREQGRIGEALGGLVPDQYQDAEEGGIAYTYGYFSPKNKRPGYLDVQVECPTDVGLQIALKGSFDRLGLALGLAKPVVTDSPDFDRRFYVTTDAPQSAEAVLRRTAAHEAIHQIFDLGFGEVRLENDLLLARWTNFKPSDDQSRSLVSDAALRLAFVAADVPPERLDPAGQGVWLRRSFFLILGVAFVASLVNVFVQPFPVLDGVTVFWYSLGGVVPCLVAFLTIAFWTFRGRTTSHTDFALLILPALICIPFAGYQGVVFVNGFLDEVPQTEHVAVVQGKHSYQTSGKHRRWVYQIFVPSWRPGEATRTLEVSAGEFQRVRPQQTRINVLTKPGFLGFEWMVAWRFEADAPRRVKLALE